MSKLRSKTLKIGGQQEHLLKQHIERLAEQSQQYIRSKIQYQQQKQARVNAIQKNFVEWAGHKENQIQHKLQKSTKNKQEHLSQIVKKCKQHEKYLAEKLKNYKDKKKTNLREAWVQSQKYNSKVDDLHASENDSKGKALKYSNQFQLANKSRARSNLKSQNKQESDPISRNHGSKNNRQFRISERHYLTLPQDNQQVKESVDQRLLKKWAQFQQNNQDLQRLKIQELGQRLQKIEQGRLKKIDLIKKRIEQHKTTVIHKPNPDAKQRLSSERSNYQSTVREKRVRDRSQTYKNRREQSFQVQLQNGNDYVSNSKIKYLKTKIAKKIEMSAIQKMLYLQRLSH